MSDQGNSAKTISVTNWVISLILLGIPLVNFICIIVWAFGGTAYKSKQTFAQANLVLWLIVIILAIIAALLIPLFGIDVREYMQAIQEQSQNQHA